MVADATFAMADKIVDFAVAAAVPGIVMDVGLEVENLQSRCYYYLADCAVYAMVLSGPEAVGAFVLVPTARLVAGPVVGFAAVHT